MAAAGKEESFMPTFQFRHCYPVLLIGVVWAALISSGCGNEESEADTVNSTDTDTRTDALDDGDTDTFDTETDIAEGEASVALLIDDFEDGDAVSLLGHSWITYDDAANDGLSHITVSQDDDGNIIPDGEGYKSERALSLSYELDQGNWIWEPYIGWSVAMGNEDAPYDASDYSGLTYAYKGSSHFVYVYTFDVTNYDYYRFYLPESEEWQVVSLPFSEFSQGGWDGISVPFNLDNIGHIGWEYKGATGDEGSIVIDNVAFLSEVSEKPDEPCVADLTIHEIEPPEDVTMESIEISNPVQATIAKKLAKGYTLSNWLESAKFESYDYDESYIEQIAANGFSALRLPIDLDFYIENRAAYFEGNTEFSIENQLFDILDDFDEWTELSGLALIIDYHQYDQSLNLSDDKTIEAAVQIWTALATHFADNPRDDIFFELLNEPELSFGVDAVDPSDWTDTASKLIEGIRNVDTSRIILVGDVEWNGIGPLIERTPFDDANIAYVFHFYEPFIFTHQGTTSGGLHTVRNIPYPYTESDWSECSSDFGFGLDQEEWQFDQLSNYYQLGTKSWMRNRIIEVKQWAVNHDVPVLCTEFGVNTGAKAASALNYYIDLIDIFEELEIPWQIWFKVMDASGDIDPEMRSALRLE